MLGLSRDYAGFSNQLKRSIAPPTSAGLRILYLGGEPGPADSSMAPALHHNPSAHRYDTGNHNQIPDKDTWRARQVGERNLLLTASSASEGLKRLRQIALPV